MMPKNQDRPQLQKRTSQLLWRYYLSGEIALGIFAVMLVETYRLITAQTKQDGWKTLISAVLSLLAFAVFLGIPDPRHRGAAGSELDRPHEQRDARTVG